MPTAGLKSYAPYTVNPRPYDVYNVQNNPTDMELIYQGYPLQMKLDCVHSRLGAPDLNFRSCACYLDEVGNAPEPGTPVAWCESSAVNYGNSVLGIRTNRYGAGMEMVCAMLGKAPEFGLMTDEGRKAKWLIDVKTIEEPDWGVLGTAIGRKCVEDIPYVAGVEQYFGGEVTNDNWHKLKVMGSATAAAGAVGCYHVEGVTPGAEGKGPRHAGRRTTRPTSTTTRSSRRSSTPSRTCGRTTDGDPTAAFIGCPHNTYEEIGEVGERWSSTRSTRPVRKRRRSPSTSSCANVVRTRILIEEEGELASKTKRRRHVLHQHVRRELLGHEGLLGSGARGHELRQERGTTRRIRYFPDQKLVDIIADRQGLDLKEQLRRPGPAGPVAHDTSNSTGD